MAPSDLRLAITLGDVRGIGPEVVDAALRSAGDMGASWVVVGPREADGRTHPFAPVKASSERPGLAAGQAIEMAVAMALSGDVDGIVTAPIHKPALAQAGFDFPGHTEMLQSLTGAPDVGMLMCHEDRTGPGRAPLRVLLATTHIPLRDVPDALTAERLERQTRLVGRAMAKDWGISRPRLALCALNPHASDGGLFGDEEERVYRPTLDALRDEVWTTVGPIPADTVFHRALNGEFDAVVAPYHDVGMAAFKTSSFGKGVNVTLGLPFVRTSPDHGTAFDIAGKGVADPSSMIEALRLAADLARKRRS